MDTPTIRWGIPGHGDIGRTDAVRRDGCAMRGRAPSRQQARHNARAPRSERRRRATRTEAGLEWSRDRCAMRGCQWPCAGPRGHGSRGCGRVASRRVSAVLDELTLARIEQERKGRQALAGGRSPSSKWRATRGCGRNWLTPNAVDPGFGAALPAQLGHRWSHRWVWSRREVSRPHVPDIRDRPVWRWCKDRQPVIRGGLTDHVWGSCPGSASVPSSPGPRT